MVLQVIFQWHKLLHFILPILFIVSLQKRLGLARMCTAIFILGFLKEVYDTVVQLDPLWVSTMDMVSNVVGIALGIVAAKVVK